MARNMNGSQARLPPRTSAITRCDSSSYVRQSQQWSEGSEESALVLTAIARFVAAHTPTRRELPTVVKIATRLRRGETLYEDESAAR